MCILHHLVAQHPELDSYKMEISLCHHHWEMISIPMVSLGWPKSSKSGSTRRMRCIGSPVNWSSLSQQRHILWSCENPGRSFMWQTTHFIALFKHIQYMSTDLHHCMFGSARRKLTKLIHNIQFFPSIAQALWQPTWTRALGTKTWRVLGHIRRDSLSMATCQVHSCTGSFAIAISRDSMSFAQLRWTGSHLASHASSH